MKLKIITTPSPLLRQKSRPILKIDKKVKQLAQEMLNLLKGSQKNEPIGVGLSAVQMGRPICLLVAYDKEDDRYLTILNPCFIKKSKKMTRGLTKENGRYEGCLSVPGYYGLVKRHQSVEVAYQDLGGQKQSRVFADYLGTIIQHEMDHLDGILFTDRVLAQKQRLYQLTKEIESKITLTKAKAL